MTKKGITSAIKELKTTIILKNSGFADAEYAKYAKLAIKFLGNRTSDPIEHGKLTVRLTRATYDLVDKKHEKEEKIKKTKGKKAKKLERRQRALPESRSDEGPEEGREQEEMQGADK